jgi:hypothetical protein
MGKISLQKKVEKKMILVQIGLTSFTLATQSRNVLWSHYQTIFVLQ